MRYFIYAVFTLLLLTSCGQNDAQVAKDLAMYKSTWDAVMNEGKLEEINETNFTTDVVSVAGAEEIKGLDAFRDYYGNFLTGFSDIEFTLLDAFGQGDKIVKHWRFQGKHTGEFFGIPASGSDVDLKGVTLVEMRDGKIARRHVPPTRPHLRPRKRSRGRCDLQGLRYRRYAVRPWCPGRKGRLERSGRQ
jgi:predicted ester cyclase